MMDVNSAFDLMMMPNPYAHLVILQGMPFHAQGQTAGNNAAAIDANLRQDVNAKNDMVVNRGNIQHDANIQQEWQCYEIELRSEMNHVSIDSEELHGYDAEMLTKGKITFGMSELTEENDIWTKDGEESSDENSSVSIVNITSTTTGFRRNVDRRQVDEMVTTIRDAGDV